VKPGFSGNPITEWLPDGRRMRLVEDFHYTTAADITHTGRKGLIIDGKTVPRPLWATFLAGPPYVGKGRNAAVIHDQMCKDAHMWAAEGFAGPAAEMREYADELFDEMLAHLGVNRLKRWVMFRGVRIGAAV